MPECSTVPLGIQKTSAFLLNTAKLDNAGDTKCDDNGSWTNNGVRKLWVTVNQLDDDCSPDVTVLKRGGGRPDASVWCLIRSYLKHKHSDDFRKVITTLQGEVYLHTVYV